MSTQEIIAELQHLTRPELEAVGARLHQLLQESPVQEPRTWGEALLSVAGVAQGLPADLSENHDHYLHNLPRR